MKVFVTVCSISFACAFQASAIECSNRFEILTQTTYVPERGSIVSHILVSDFGRFAFIPPRAMRQSLQTVQRKVSFTSQDYGIMMTLQFSPDRPPVGEARLADFARQQWRERFPQARLLETGECYAGSLRGLTFDLEHQVEQVLQRVRFCLIPLPQNGGNLVFTLTAPPERFDALHLPFMSWVGSFEGR